ncbi:MAG: hypothetical protein NC453_11965 [Muribaculum sp.]|nr:hypothetical protein [Muribaculum sp.]
MDSKDKLPIIILLATTFLPGNGTFNIIKIVIVFILTIKYGSSRTNSLTTESWRKIIVLWFWAIVIASASVLVFEQHFNTGVFGHEISRILYYGLVMYLCSRLQVSIKFLFYCCSIVLCIHFAVQVTQYLRMGIFDPYIVKYYLAGNIDNIHYQLATQDYYQFRSGSIFINPNVYVCYPYLSLAVFLEYRRFTHSTLPTLMCVVAFASVVLTGSRMGLGSCFLIFGWYMFFGNKDKTKDTSSNLIPVALGIVITIILALNWESIGKSTSDLRAFNLSEAYEGSGSAKLGGFIAYLTHCNPVYWITGSLGSQALNVQYDMELGYVFGWFGVLGIIWYKDLIKLVYHNNRGEFRVLSTVATLSILLTAIGATSVLNMSVFPYICVISLTTLVPSSFEN